MLDDGMVTLMTEGVEEEMLLRGLLSVPSCLIAAAKHR